MKTMIAMKTVKTFAVAAAVAMACSAGVSFGDILDEGLGPKTPAPAQVKPAPGTPGTSGAPGAPAAPAKPAGAAPAPQPTRPKLNDLVDPGAARKVDDQDIVKKLTGDGVDDGGQSMDPEKKMIEVMDRMGQAEDRLSDKKDPGLLTQETQQRIVTDLDSTIEYLRKQDQQSSSQGSGKPKPGQGQKKQESKGNQQGGEGQGKGKGKGKGGTEGAHDSDIKSGSADPLSSNDTDLRQTGKNWGNLPPGDRELVAHGASEQYLPEYKEMIKRYYEALAEIGRSSDNH